MSEKEAEATGTAAKVPTCGIIMPISALDGCTEQHWLDVREFIFDSIQNAEFEPNLVSDADDVGIIQKRIIQNLYLNPMVVCDVSGKNPNVMFELGIRLAFDKPTIIIKDDKTSYSFDTSPIEHLEYPRDLRFNRIIDFKAALQDKLKGTYKKATEDKSYTTFLKNFGQFAVAKLDTTELPKDEFILEEMAEMRRQMQYLVSRLRPFRQNIPDIIDRDSLRNHRYTTEDCKVRLNEAVRLIQSMMVAKGIPKKDIFSAATIIEKARELDIFPECFREENVACAKRLDAAIAEGKIELYSEDSNSKRVKAKS
jgi:hypothetical protein